MKTVRIYLETIDLFKKPQRIPYIKSKEKERGSILGGIFTIITVFLFFWFVLIRFINFFDFNND